MYASDLNGGPFLDRIRADWPGDSGSSNYNCTPACRINVQPGDRWDWDVLHHEYGHYVMDEFDFEDSPGGPHNLGACAAIAQGDKDDGMKLAWAEGWPTYFGTAGQRQRNMAALNVPRVGDVSYTETEESSFSYSLESNTGGLPPSGDGIRGGEDNEVAVQRLFWDLFDTNSDSRDHVSVSDQTLFNIVASTDPHSLSAAWAPIRATLNNEQDLAYGAITTDHLIGPACVSPANDAEITQSNATFQWTRAVECDASLMGNSFDLVFYRASDFTKALTIPGLTGTSHTLTPSEYLAVRAWGPEILWAVEGRSTAGPSTGPYLGESRTIFMYPTPSNNDCANARSVGDSHVIGTTNGATADGSDTCVVSSRPDVWFSYTASCTGLATFDTCGSDSPTYITVHDGCPGTFNNQLACESFSCGDPAQVSVTVGQSYLVRAADATSSSGDFQINILCTPQANLCDDALPIGIGEFRGGSTEGTSISSAPVCEMEDVTAPGVWYAVIGNGNELTASLCGTGTDYDTKISVYCGGCGNLQCRKANDDACGTKSSVTWCSAPGAVYHILVHGYVNATGDFRLDVTDTGNFCGPLYLNCSPANNTCSTATEIGTGTFIGDNTASTTVGSATCAPSNSDVWYGYVPVCNGFVRVETCGETGSLDDTVLSIYDECGGRELRCNDDSACGRRSSTVVPVYADDPIKIRVADFGSTMDVGTFPLTVSGSGMIAPLVSPPPGLYVADGAGFLEDSLIRIPYPASGAQVIGPLTQPDIVGMTYAFPLGLLYGVNNSPANDFMVVINPQTGAVTPIGSLAHGDIQALVYDPDDHVLYGTDATAGQLVRIDPFTGVDSTVGSIGFADVRSLVRLPWDVNLWGVDVATDQLILINKSTGAGTVIAALGPDFGQIEGMAFDWTTNRLYAVQANPGGGGDLVEIDTETGQAAYLDSYASTGPTSLAIIPGLPDAMVGVSYGAQAPVTGGCPRYFFGNPLGLPSGLNLSNRGELVGTPDQAGDYEISFDVGDSNLGSPAVHATLPLRVRPANDYCVDALTVPIGETEFRTSGSTTDGPDEPGSCYFSGDSHLRSDVWFCHTATCTGDLTVSLCDSSYDSKLAVYGGCACPVTAPPLACNDDFCGGTGLQSSVTIPSVHGQDYLIRVAGYAGTTGDGMLMISCAECASAADCNDANECTADTCVDGLCAHSFLACNDQDPCTIDDCNPAIGCTHDPLECDDNDACTTGTCDAMSGACNFKPVDCDDNDDCTLDVCFMEFGCGHALIDCDGDTVCDFDDNCPSAPNADQNNTDGDSYGDACDGPFDADHDGDIDRPDYGDFENCLLGPDVLPSATCRELHDVDQTSEVDLGDFADMQNLFSGSTAFPCD